MTRARDRADSSPTISGDLTVSGDLVPSTPLSHRNMIINGGMQVWQRATTTTTATSSFDTVDRWSTNNGTGGAYTTEKHSMSLAEINTTGHATALQVDCTTIDSSIGASQYANVFTRIEAQDCQHLQYGSASAKTLTLSFWVKSNKTGTYTIYLAKDDATAYYYQREYTISSADTWEQKTITITPTAGSTSLITGSGGIIANDNGRGLTLGFNFAFGSTFHGSNDTWSASASYATSNQVNWMDSTSNNFYLTGVQLELGSNATPFEHWSYGDELARCLRYYNVIGSGIRAVGSSYGTTGIAFSYYLSTQMRDTPTLVQINSASHRVFKASGYSASTTNCTISNLRGDIVQLNAPGHSGLTDNSMYVFYMDGSYKIGLSSEL